MSTRPGGSLEIIEYANSVVEVAPAAGGCITRFAVHGHDVMRSARRSAESVNDPLVKSCFPLVPYSGRIRNGRFSFDGREVREQLNFAPSPHAIHGHGWKLPWSVIERDAVSLMIEYHYAGDAWPFPYSARQRFAVSSSGSQHACLSVDIEVHNTGATRMPAGLGLHPYFPRTADARICAVVDGCWEMDAEVMPVRWHALPDDHPLRTGLAPDVTALDNAFTGYAGRAEVTWAERGVRLVMRSGAELGTLVVFTPDGEDFFCVEPVSNGTDAFNRAAAGDASTGMRVLAPGEVFSARVDFDVDVQT